MPLLRQLFRIQTVSTPGLSAATYVPWVMVSRGLAFLRTLIVAHILGKAGEAAFGLYQPALELINPLVALVMFGAADVAERYIARITRDHGTAGVRRFLLRQWLRIGISGGLVAGVMIALASWISPIIWGSPQFQLLALCAAAIFALAFYQHLAATLRGLRAFGAAAGMEVTSALVLIAASISAAYLNDAAALIGAYLVSILLPLFFYALLLSAHLRRNPVSSSAPSSVAPPTPSESRRLTSFAFWTMIRLLLVLVFSFLSLWGLKAIETRLPGGYNPAHTAQFSMPYRIAQLLGFVAVTSWASSYGIAARAWSHGQIRRAKAQYFRIGRVALMCLTLIAVGLLLARSLFGMILHDYAQSIVDLLPRMLALFIGYALLTFLSGYADLRETPEKGALLWTLAVVIQIATLALGAARATEFFAAPDPMRAIANWILTGSALGLAVALLVGFRLLCRPFLSHAGLPLALLGIATASLFWPYHVSLIAAGTMSSVTLILFLTASLVRPYDVRAFRRWRQRRSAVSLRAERL